MIYKEDLGNDRKCGKAISLLNAALDCQNDQAKVCAACYVLLRCLREKDISIDTLDRFLETARVSGERAGFLRWALDERWLAFRELNGKLDEEVLIHLILFYEPDGLKDENNRTPGGVIRLAMSLLEIQPGDRVADFCTGTGGFLRDCALRYPEASYYGSELNPTCADIASIRAELLPGQIKIQEENFFQGQHARSFDTVFAHFPFGQQVRDAQISTGDQAWTLMGRREYAAPASMDWVFSRLLYDTVSGPRRAVCIVTNGSTCNLVDRLARREFLSMGIVEAVIALPEKLFGNTPIGTSMLVLSHGNSSVMMVDARTLCHKGRRLNELTPESVREILQAIREEGLYSKRVPCETLIAGDCMLDPVRWIEKTVTVENGRPFEEVIRRITRGAQLKASELDKLASNEPTRTRYLMLSDIQDGIVSGKLPYLKGLDRKLEKYCIPTNSLVMSKFGEPFKIAVVRVPEGEQILASGNLYIIQLDEKQAEPYYIKAFLESPKGSALLRSVAVGAVVPSLSVAQLKQLPIPKTSLVEQKAISHLCRAAEQQIKRLREQLDDAIQDMRNLLEEQEF